jgi:hypothetical protein
MACASVAGFHHRSSRKQAQPGQRAQDREPVGVHVVDQLEYLLPLALQVHLVELAVPRVQAHL